LISRGARIDSFGVGTELATSYDEPALSGVYKLAGIEENGRISMRIKLSHDKATYPGAKQVWRFKDNSGKYSHDVITLADEEPPAHSADSIASARPLLKPVMAGGRRVATGSSNNDKLSNNELRNSNLSRARDLARTELEHLPHVLLEFESRPAYSLKFSERIVAERENLELKIAETRSCSDARRIENV